MSPPGQEGAGRGMERSEGDASLEVTGLQQEALGARCLCRERGRQAGSHAAPWRVRSSCLRLPSGLARKACPRPASLGAEAGARCTLACPLNAAGHWTQHHASPTLLCYSLRSPSIERGRCSSSDAPMPVLRAQPPAMFMFACFSISFGWLIISQMSPIPSRAPSVQPPAMSHQPVARVHGEARKYRRPLADVFSSPQPHMEVCRSVPCLPASGQPAHFVAPMLCLEQSQLLVAARCL